MFRKGFALDYIIRAKRKSRKASLSFTAGKNNTLRSRIKLCEAQYNSHKLCEYNYHSFLHQHRRRNKHLSAAVINDIYGVKLYGFSLDFYFRPAVKHHKTYSGIGNNEHYNAQHQHR